MTRAEYNALPGINFSLLKLYLKSPAHFLHAWMNKEEDKEETKALMMGKAIHTLVLEPETFVKLFTFLDLEDRPVKLNSKGNPADFRTKANAEWRDFAMNAAKESGQTMLMKDDYETILQMAESIKANDAAKALLKGCDNEVIIEWTDKESEVKCKAIVDFHNKTKRMLGELKSMEDASPSAVSSYIQKWNTHTQVAYYSDGLESVNGHPYNSAFLIASEKQPPNICQPYFMNEEDIELGRLIYKALLKIHAKCVKENKWGSYDTQYENIHGVIVANLPGWAKAKIEADYKLQNN